MLRLHMGVNERESDNVQNTKPMRERERSAKGQRREREKMKRRTRQQIPAWLLYD